MRKSYATRKPDGIFRIYPKCLGRQSWANSVDPDQMLQNAAADLGLPCLPVIQQFLESPEDCQIDLFKFQDRYG